MYSPNSKSTLILLTLLYASSIAGDLYVIKGQVQAELVLQFLTLLFIGLSVIRLSRQFRRFPTGYLVTANWHLLLYLAGLVTLQAMVHGVAMPTLVRLLGYSAVAVLGYIFLASSFMSNSSLFQLWMKTVAFFSGLIAITALASALGLNAFAGLTFSDKSTYQVLGINATGGILEHPLTLGTQMVFGIGASLFLIRESSHWTRYLLLALCGLGLLVSMARGAWLAGGFAFLCFVCTARSPHRTMARFAALIISGAAIAFIMLPYAYTLAAQSEVLSNALRLDYGLSNRGLMWPIALDLLGE